MRALVTGATGFLGSAVARRLLAGGHEVRVLVRPAADRRNLAGLDVDHAEGDLLERESLRRAVAGCDALFHVAADYRLWVPDPDRMYRINVEGTRELLLSALEAGVDKVVYTSSVATLGVHPDRSPANEETPADEASMVGHYKRSKFLAEQVVREIAARERAPVVIVNPSAPLGPGDIKPTPTGRVIVDAARGRIPAFVDTGLNVVHVDDVAAGHVLAFEKGEAGRRYILGGENISLRELLAGVCRAAGRRPPRIRIPHDAVMPIAWMAERVAGFTGAEPFATVDSVKMARKFMYFSSDRARRELGYRHRPVEEALNDAVRWFKENRYC
ncbi:MAG: NAD-dependent epimerase/dehydratase family protein [Gammaproteobacteria bacterium]|nr:NAD-dependent epimerase/dehydratase family protein [Gammaproteobacteria bacterium]